MSYQKDSKKKAIKRVPKEPRKMLKSFVYDHYHQLAFLNFCCSLAHYFCINYWSKQQLHVSALRIKEFPQYTISSLLVQTRSTSLHSNYFWFCASILVLSLGISFECLTFVFTLFSFLSFLDAHGFVQVQTPFVKPFFHLRLFLAFLLGFFSILICFRYKSSLWRKTDH